ncbi:MAG: hypothetical protein B6244_06475 [Candidatus Cloacimonetes bacterium 4572_55]|nr:MAG: hypothetical protein B6244_06475 [Candidatus Cloacimonetes bacterium 4572_55]
MDTFRISVVIPTYNSAETLRELLDSLFRSDYSDYKNPFEVVVIDDCSTDDTQRVLLDFPDVLSIFLDRNRGPAYARNLGVEKARGQFILFLDSDVVVQPDTLRRTSDFFSAHPASCIMIGVYLPEPKNKGIFPRYKALQCLSYYAHLPDVSLTTIFWTGIAAICKETFCKLGGFDSDRYPTPGLEDVDLGRRAGHRGHRIRLDRNVQVSHNFSTDLWGNFKNHYHRGVQWGELYLRSGKFDNYVTTRIHAFGRICAFLSLIFLIFAPFSSIAGYIGIFLIVLYLIANFRLLRVFIQKAPLSLPLLILIDYILAIALGLAGIRVAYQKIKDFC